MKKPLSLTLAIVLLSAGLNAQDIKPCGTTEAMQEHYKNHPEEKSAWDAREALYEAQDAEAYKTGYGKNTNQKNGPNQIQAPILYIPVVVHVMHQGGSENISDAQVKDAIRILTRDFRQQNPDTTATVAAFKTLAADVEVEFKLATIDPNGNCTNGIIRHNSPNTVWTSGQSSYYAYTGTTAGKWNPTKYLNIYTVKSISSGAAGYTYLPGTFGAGSAMDAIVILSTYMGSIGTGSAGTSRALTHEVGHWLNLPHVWGSTNQPGVSCGNEGVSDTPVTEGSNLVCPLTDASCGALENVQNYMDYSYCSTMYTAGQSTRMRNCLGSTTSGRNNLVTTANNSATGITTPQVCAPIANFRATVRTVCPNYVITFSDSSSNASPTSWNWSFPGGTFQNGTTATDSMPKVSYAAAGTYAVSYTATTSAGSAPITKNAYINVLSNVASYNAQFVEGFETTTLPGTDWNVYNGGGNDWTVSSAAAATGTKSTKLDNMTNPAGNVSILESTSFDISGFITPKLSFKYAYKLKATGDNDRLQVLTSTDCGSTWVSRWSRNSTTLANVTPPSTSAFTPTSGQFATYTVNINGVAGSTNVRFRWVFTSDYGGNGVVGNNLFMDDINLWDASLGITGAEELVSLVIYPNPSSGSVTLDMNLAEGHTISVNVTDVLGRSIESIPSKAYATGELSLSIGKEKVYQPGVYFVNMDVDGKQITRKVIIQ